MTHDLEPNLVVITDERLAELSKATEKARAINTERAYLGWGGDHALGCITADGNYTFVNGTLDEFAALLDALTAERARVVALTEETLHPSHVTRISMDASSYDEICVNCGATDHIGGWGALAKPCPKTPPATVEQEPVAKPIGYARSVDVDPADRPMKGRNSFWCSENQSAYYSVPVYLATPPAKPGAQGLDFEALTAALLVSEGKPS